MSTTLPEAPVAPGRTSRLLRGIQAGAPEPGLAEHLERWGSLHHAPPKVMLNELDVSGLAGHGGAWFPVGTKWRSVGQHLLRTPVVVANGAESEPASHKDALLLTHAPHLVLDGLAVAAHTLRAGRAVVYVAANHVALLEHAIEDRRRLGLDLVTIEVAEAPDIFLAGQESAVVNALGGRPARPSFVGLESVRDRGVGGRPTLVQNVETLAHVALVARYGAQWFRRVGTPECPGTMLLTLNRPGGPLIVEAALGSSLLDVIGLTSGDAGRFRGALLGGYGGGWVSMTTLADLPVSEKAVRRAGATLGAGVVALLPTDVCPLAEMADVVRYMDRQGAGQCGPCVHGLAGLAEATDDLAYGSARRRGLTERILAACDLVEDRGACRHPDGVARFVRSGLGVFSDEVTRHQQHGSCTKTRAPRTLPVPNRLGRRIVVRRA